tara:strand:+ start:1047 stop:1406 length:360 start_codon:yes stop_codon:yes gene_type:complete
MENTLTIKEALSQGYKYCGKHVDGWQGLTHITDLTPEDFKFSEWHVISKDEQFFKFGKDEISELLAEQISESEADETGRDDDQIYNAIKAIDFSGTEELINEVLLKNGYYILTDIKLNK